MPHKGAEGLCYNPLRVTPRYVQVHPRDNVAIIVNPDGVKNQIEGNVLQAVSRALLEEVKFDSTGQKNLDWDSYPVIRFGQIPEVEIVLIDRPEMQPLGGGEPSIVPVTAAIANAIFDATGARLRQVPFTPQRVLSALKA